MVIITIIKFFEMKKIINLSRVPGLFLWTVLLFIPVSCSKEAGQESPLANSSQMIKISGEDVSVATKTTLNLLVTSWVANTDFVGIYSPQAKPTSGGSAGVTNRKYIATASASSSAFSPASDNEMYWGTGTHNFYAYYPYSAAGTDATLVPISLPTAQTQVGNSSTHIGNYDFMVATPVTDATPGTEGGATTVNLRYNHVFTVLEFQIKRSSGSAKITKIKLTAPTINLSLTSGTINITTDTPGAAVPYTISSPVGTNEITLTISGGVTPTANYATTPKIYMMILPGDFSAESMTIGIEYESSGIFINNVKTGINFERGKKYVVQIDVPIDGDGNTYGTVTSAGKIWLDRNLGATQVATSSTDAAAYGDLYQWGRGSDGHQIRTPLSGTTSTLSGTDIPGHANFILATTSPWDWLSLQNGSLWQGVSGVNNPCPSGFRLPTNAELGAERASWSSNNSAGAYASPLKFTVAGHRNLSYGSLENVGSSGFYWSSTVDGTSSSSLDFFSGDAGTESSGRAFGSSVRCIKN